MFLRVPCIVTVSSFTSLQPRYFFKHLAQINGTSSIGRSLQENEHTLLFLHGESA